MLKPKTPRNVIQGERLWYLKLETGKWAFVAYFPGREVRLYLKYIFPPDL